MKIGVNKKLGHHAHLAELILELGGTWSEDREPQPVPFQNSLFRVLFKEVLLWKPG
jgi:hypothetical protein